MKLKTLFIIGLMLSTILLGGCASKSSFLDCYNTCKYQYPFNDTNYWVVKDGDIFYRETELTRNNLF